MNCYISPTGGDYHDDVMAMAHSPLASGSSSPVIADAVPAAATNPPSRRRSRIEAEKRNRDKYLASRVHGDTMGSQKIIPGGDSNEKGKACGQHHTMAADKRSYYSDENYHNFHRDDHYHEHDPSPIGYCDRSRSIEKRGYQQEWHHPDARPHDQHQQLQHQQFHHPMRSGSSSSSNFPGYTADGSSRNSSTSSSSSQFHHHRQYECSSSTPTRSSSPWGSGGHQQMHAAQSPRTHQVTLDSDEPSDTVSDWL